MVKPFNGDIGNGFGFDLSGIDAFRGCVTPSILVQLGALSSLDCITGFKDLQTVDKNRIRTAVTNKKVDDADKPPTARASQFDTLSSSRKRKALEDIPAEGRGHISPPSHSQPRVFDVEDDEADSFEEARDELYCALDTNVVGIQYYTGLVGSGEEVILQREPRNKFDANAIQVMNIAHTQVGHLPRNVAAKLAPLLDRGLIVVEGVIRKRQNRYTMSMYLKIFGPTEKRAQLEPLLVWATPGQRGFNSVAADSSHSQQGKSKKTNAQQQEALSKAAELKKMLENLEKVNIEDKRSSLLDTLCATGDIFNLPVHPNPPGLANGLLTVELLKHQQQALQWCLEHENPVLPTKETNKPVQFWQIKKMDGKDVFYNIATKTPQQVAPSLGRGAIFADAMGLGKTLTMLALILTTKLDIPRECSNSTLVVVPLSILSNWEHQIAEHCSPGSLSSYIYYGNNRSMDAEELAKYDVIITTYQVVAAEHLNVSMSQGNKRKKKIQNLFAVHWKRVVLDEGHIIRNPKTKTALAVCALTAQRRWVLTGTPIINSPRDLGSLLTFLQICRPLNQQDFFKRLLLRPLKDGHPNGAELLKAMMNQICIRRTKEMQDQNGVPLVPLPPVDMTIIPVTLSFEARDLYDKVEALSKQRLEHYLQTSVMVQSNILSMLTRLRQIALHPALVPRSYIEDLRLTTTNEESSDASIVPVSPKDRVRLEDKLRTAIEDCESCPICFSIVTEPRITACGHIFCFPCITESISRAPKCPMDRRTISLKDLYEAPSRDDLTQQPIQHEDENEDYRNAPSAKIDQLVRLLKAMPTTDKVLVFSQFTSFLNKIGETLEENGISYVRFDGQMSAKRRQETLSQFSTPLAQDYKGVQDDSDYNDAQRKKGKEKRKNQNSKVMLISLKAGALGLNLTVANHVILMDPWWQEGIESQAIDRVNRIGQTKDVHVYQLIAEDTVEQKVLEIQDRKKKLIQAAFSGTRRTEKERERKETRLQELLELFGMGNAE